MLHNLEDIVKQQDIMTDSINTAFQNQAEAGLLQMYYMNFLENSKTKSATEMILFMERTTIIILMDWPVVIKSMSENGNDTLIGGTGDDYIVEEQDRYLFL